MSDDGADAAADEGELRAASVDADGHGQRLDRWLVALAPEFSRSHLQQLIADALVRIDGAVQTSASRRLAAGQRIEVQLRPTAQSAAFRSEPMALDIVYEDEQLLVVNKPAGLVVHPAAGNWSGTLLNGLLAHHPGAAGLARAGIVHRLDKDTSGLMVVAKTLVAQTALVRAIAAREVRREYLALAHGRHAPGLTVIERPIGRDPVSRVRMAVHPAGKPARTDATCLGSVDASDGGGTSAVSAWHCRLHSGRTHQIRVHLASIGHPLLADAVYGGRPLLGLQRQALHAARLAFAHPASGAWRVFSAAMPADLDAAWRALGDAVVRAAATMLETRGDDASFG
ncbi:MAG TPA: RluA family pseudouridine synthase [Burkholderiaceae bacterium]|nr:RluA family pseudouridine synthase [Burkholderiaceae bacterium]HMZ00729.1 RluA family pseudouridine synthase [Burkholderiaceae bacterium]HNB45774.1 RluA family pseudouridine synthase [Burkholderiaceae bacterium]